MERNVFFQLMIFVIVRYIDIEIYLIFFLEYICVYFSYPF